MNVKISIGGQSAYCHRKSLEYGYFHTYDAFSLNGDTRKIQVFLPSEYETSKHRYPVIYMNDGQTVFHSGGLSPWSWDVDATLEDLSRKGEVEKVVIVAVYPVDRNREYLPKESSFAKDMGLQEGRLDVYGSYLANILKPFIDKNYSVDSSADKTAIVGSSFGGIVALYVAAKYPEKFGIGGIMSPSFTSVISFDEVGISEKNTEFLREVEESLRTAKKKPSYWIDWGGQEGLLAKTAPMVARMLKDKYGYKEGKNIHSFYDEIATHDERAWKYRFGLFLKAFYSKK